MKIDKDREGVERVRAAGYYPYSGESEESWDGLVSTGEERHAEYRKWKASQGARPKIVSAPSVSDDEIPF